MLTNVLRSFRVAFVGEWIIFVGVKMNNLTITSGILKQKNAHFDEL